MEGYAAAIYLRSVSPNTCRYLRVKLKYPLPALSTFRKWALKSLNSDEGILQDVLKRLTGSSKILTVKEWITVLSYEMSSYVLYMSSEMYLSEEILFDSNKRTDSRTLQVRSSCFCMGSYWKVEAVNLLQV